VLLLPDVWIVDSLQACLVWGPLLWTVAKLAPGSRLARKSSEVQQQSVGDRVVAAMPLLWMPASRIGKSGMRIRCRAVVARCQNGVRPPLFAYQLQSDADTPMPKDASHAGHVADCFNLPSCCRAALRAL
jgi:predicted DNA repair protein MutK